MTRVTASLQLDYKREREPRMDTDLRGLDRNTPYQKIALGSALCHAAKETYLTLSRRSSTPKILVNLRSSAIGRLVCDPS